MPIQILIGLGYKTKPLKSGKNLLRNILRIHFKVFIASRKTTWPKILYNILNFTIFIDCACATVCMSVCIFCACCGLVCDVVLYVCCCLLCVCCPVCVLSYIYVLVSLCLHHSFQFSNSNDF